MMSVAKLGLSKCLIPVYPLAHEEPWGHPIDKFIFICCGQLWLSETMWNPEVLGGEHPMFIRIFPYQNCHQFGVKTTMAGPHFIPSPAAGALNSSLGSRQGRSWQQERGLICRFFLKLWYPKIIENSCLSVGQSMVWDTHMLGNLHIFSSISLVEQKKNNQWRSDME